MRIAFDLDGVLADMESALVREARTLFGDQVITQRPAEATGSAGSGSETPPSGEPPADAASESVPEAVRPTRVRLSPRQQTRLWRRVQALEGFWESLDELEPGAVARLSSLAAERNWEVVFLTRRPECAGATSQVQSQRWLRAKGFDLPSVFVVPGSRGRITAALDLDFLVDDLPENCADVTLESQAKAILVWRRAPKALPVGAKRMGIAVVWSVQECLDILTEIDSLPQQEPTFKDRVMRLLGLKSEPARV